MSVAFLLVGGFIFTTYIVILLWVMFDQNHRQREEGNGSRGYYVRHNQLDTSDYDGMGNVSRFPEDVFDEPKKRSYVPNRRNVSRRRSVSADKRK